MNGKVTIFPSGKMISVGTNSVENAVNNFNLAMNALSRNKLAEPTMLKITVRNIVATVDFETNINVEKMSLKLDAVYEPEQFPGAIMHVETAKITVQLFASGKGVITGAKNLQDINEAVLKLSDLLTT